MQVNSDIELYNGVRNAVISFYREHKKPTKVLAENLVDLVNQIGQNRGITLNFTLRDLGIRK